MDKISIHALLAESDNTRTKRIDRNIAFLSTLSLRRATSVCPDNRRCDAISIHALLAESDDVIAVMTDAQSISIHALLAESDTRSDQGANSHGISIHALLAESDSWFSYFRYVCRVISIHALLAESDFHATVSSLSSPEFLSTLSLRRATVDR